ncbi:MAG: hypothetical protein ACO38I_05585 [Ilumatobacteraceae bacterium]
MEVEAVGAPGIEQSRAARDIASAFECVRRGKAPENDAETHLFTDGLVLAATSARVSEKVREALITCVAQCMCVAPCYLYDLPGNERRRGVRGVPWSGAVVVRGNDKYGVEAHRLLLRSLPLEALEFRGSIALVDEGYAVEVVSCLRKIRMMRAETTVREIVGENRESRDVRVIRSREIFAGMLEDVLRPMLDQALRDREREMERTRAKSSVVAMATGEGSSTLGFAPTPEAVLDILRSKGMPRTLKPGREMEDDNNRPGCFRYVLENEEGKECPLHGRVHDSAGSAQYAFWDGSTKTLTLRCFRGPPARRL